MIDTSPYLSLRFGTFGGEDHSHTLLHFKIYMRLEMAVDRVSAGKEGNKLIFPEQRGSLEMLR